MKQCPSCLITFWGFNIEAILRVAKSTPACQNERDKWQHFLQNVYTPKRVKTITCHIYILRTPKFKNSKTTKYEVFYSSHFLHAVFQFALKKGETYQVQPCSPQNWHCWPCSTSHWGWQAFWMLGGLFGRRNSRISRVEGCEVVGWALFIVCQMWGKGDALLML